MQAVPSTAIAGFDSSQLHLLQQQLLEQQLQQQQLQQQSPQQQFFLQHCQKNYQQAVLQLKRFPLGHGNCKELQPQGQTNIVPQQTQEWLSPEPRKSQFALVPGVGRVRKSDLVLLRAIHKGELDVDDENAPDISVLRPEQLQALEAFFDRAEEKPSPFCKTLVHESPLKEPQDSWISRLRPEVRAPPGLEDVIRAPPGLEDVIRVVPRTARPVASVY
jgi:hypothetical protein